MALPWVEIFFFADALAWSASIAVHRAAVPCETPGAWQLPLLFGAKENDELRHRVNSGGSASKRGQAEGRARSNSRGRSGSNSRHGSGSKKHAHKKKVNYDSDR